MSTFQFEAMNSQGQVVKDEVEALNTEEAIQKIRARKLFPTSIKEKIIVNFDSSNKPTDVVLQK